MSFNSAREAGVLLHITSLPGGGCLDSNARQFVSWLSTAGFRVWQILPVGPTHADGSPYLSLSAHAGNPAFISIAELLRDKALASSWLGQYYATKPHFSALQLAQGWKAEFSPDGLDGFSEFVQANADWLEPYALFMTVRSDEAGRPWWLWPAALRDRDPAAMAEQVRNHASLMQAFRIEQYLFERQWQALKQYANDLQIRLFGDMALYVAHDSVDVWANRALFALDADGAVLIQAGVPPDAFSADGQVWGNPVFNWAAHTAENFAWWLLRIEAQRKRFDLLRIDHFRGMQAYWAIPAGDRTAINGCWVEAPGDALLTRIQEQIPDLELVAEDLGLITPEVDGLRKDHHLPGMRVMEFAFDGDDDNPHRPHNQTVDSVVYTGTHDNDTVLGWYLTLDEGMRHTVNAALAIESAEAVVPAMIKATLDAPGVLAILPMQDILGLGSEARMNTPATVENNWTWQLDWTQMRGVSPDDWRQRLLASGRLNV